MQIDRHQLGGHEAPDDRFTEDDRVVREAGDEHHDKDDLAQKFDDAGQEGQYFFAHALQCIPARQQDAQHGVEGGVPDQIPCAVFQHHRLRGTGHQPDRVRKGMKEIYLYSVVVAVLAVLLMRAAAPWMVAFVSGSSEPVVLENGARYLLWNAPFYAVLGVLLSTRYALQSLGNKVLPLFSSVIELVGKIIFVLLLIPKFAYNAVILCEPIIWCFMAAYLVLVYLHDPFVFPKKAE